MGNTATGTTGSTVPKRQLGRHLRKLRNQAGFTVKLAAHEMEFSEAKIWRIESGQVALRSLDVEAMCRLYGAPDDLTGALKALAKETKARGWWHSFGDVIPEGFDVYIGLEEAASHFRWYEPELVPGLLQTEAYTRALIAESRPDSAPEEIERLIHVQTSRKALVTRTIEPPMLHVVINEAVLKRPVGGPDVMAAQLQHLVELSQRPNIDLRVVPFAAGMHPGVRSGAFIMLGFPVNGTGEPSEPTTVYLNHLAGELYLDKDREVNRYEAVFTNLWAVSLDETVSEQMLTTAAKEIAK